MKNGKNKNKQNFGNQAKVLLFSKTENYNGAVCKL